MLEGTESAERESFQELSAVIPARRHPLVPPWMPETAHTVSAYGPTLAGCRGGPCARPIREPVLDQRYSGPTQTTGAHKGRPYGLIPPEVALYALTLSPPRARL